MFLQKNTSNNCSHGMTEIDQWKIWIFFFYHLGNLNCRIHQCFPSILIREISWFPIFYTFSMSWQIIRNTCNSIFIQIFCKCIITHFMFLHSMHTENNSLCFSFRSIKFIRQILFFHYKNPHFLLLIFYHTKKSEDYSSD